MSRVLRSFVAVSDDQERAELLDALMADTNDYDVVVLESIACGYSRIKQEAPELVVVCLGIDDAATCRLLSMLAMDADTAAIPVLTWAARRRRSELEHIIAELNQDSVSHGTAIQMN
jgi:DNA-binding response OmpR family regulator